MADDHPLWVVSGTDLDARPPAKHLSGPEQLLTPEGRWVDAHDLRPGDLVLTHGEGVRPVTETYLAYGQTTVYNFEVNTVGTYGVGPNGILVHNRPWQIKEIPFKEAPKTGEPALPPEAWNKNAPRQVTPGTKTLEQTKYNPKTGQWEKSTVEYDQYVRQVKRTDYTDHGYPDDHTVPHTHETEYNSEYPNGHPK